MIVGTLALLALLSVAITANAAAASEFRKEN